MRQILLALASTFILLVGCDDREMENQLAATETALASEKEKRLAAERRADEAEALNAEFRARGYPLTELLIKVAIEARSLGHRPQSGVSRRSHNWSARTAVSGNLSILMLKPQESASVRTEPTA